MLGCSIFMNADMTCEDHTLKIGTRTFSPSPMSLNYILYDDDVQIYFFLVQVQHCLTEMFPRWLKSIPSIPCPHHSIVTTLHEFLKLILEIQFFSVTSENSFILLKLLISARQKVCQLYIFFIFNWSSPFPLLMPQLMYLFIPGLLPMTFYPEYLLPILSFSNPFSVQLSELFFPRMLI